MKRRSGNVARNELASRGETLEGRQKAQEGIDRLVRYPQASRDGFTAGARP